MAYYYDNFTDQIVLEKNPYAPPERYFELDQTDTDGLYIDTYYTDRFAGEFIQYAYSEANSWKTNYDKFKADLTAFLESKGCSKKPEDLLLIKRQFPPREFAEIIEKFAPEAPLPEGVIEAEFVDKTDPQEDEKDGQH